MLSKKVSLGAAEFASPADAAWSQAKSQKVDLMPVPVAMQPSIYITSTMGNRPIGKVKQVKVSSLHNGSEIAIRMEWADPDRNLERVEQELRKAARRVSNEAPPRTAEELLHELQVHQIELEMQNTGRACLGCSRENEAVRSRRQDQTGLCGVGGREW